MSDNSQQVISFDEILRGKSARITTIDGKMYISAIDIVMALTDKDNNQAAEVLRKLDNYDREELEENLRHFQFQGQGQRPTPVVDLAGAITLVDSLKCQRAREYKRDITKLFQKMLQTESSTPTVDMSPKTDKNTPQPKLKVGYVYATTSDAFPGLVKIGRTDNLSKRMSSANTFCAPAPHVIVASASSLDNVRDENKAHCHFRDRHVKGEFFRVSVEEVQTYFDEHIESNFKKEMDMAQAGLLDQTYNTKGVPADLLFKHWFGFDINQVKMSQNASDDDNDDGLVSLDIWERRVRIKRIQADTRRVEAEIKRVEAETKRVQAETRQAQVDTIEKASSTYTKLCSNGIMDDRARNIFKECLLANIQ